MALFSFAPVISFAALFSFVALFSFAGSTAGAALAGAASFTLDLLAVTRGRILSIVALETPRFLEVPDRGVRAPGDDLLRGRLAHAGQVLQLLLCGRVQIDLRGLRFGRQRR